MAESHYGVERAERDPSSKKVTVVEIRARKSVGPHLVAVTAYDYPMARLLDQGGVDVLLVGDSLGMVWQGLPNTLPVTLDEICYHGRAVGRARPRAHVVGDMPFMSYQSSVERAVENAGRMLKEGAFEAVKLEGGEAIVPQIRAITEAGIPVMGHLGLRPQSLHMLGGFRVQAKTGEAITKIVADARALEHAGVYAIVLEAIPPDVALQVTTAVGIPTIGIGAGPHCDGQVLVCNDMLGISDGPGPRFAKRYADLGREITVAATQFAAEVRSGSFPADEHTYAASENGPRAATPPEARGRRPA